MDVAVEILEIALYYTLNIIPNRRSNNLDHVAHTASAAGEKSVVGRRRAPQVLPDVNATNVDSWAPAAVVSTIMYSEAVSLSFSLILKHLSDWGWLQNEIPFWSEKTLALSGLRDLVQARKLKTRMQWPWLIYLIEPGKSWPLPYERLEISRAEEQTQHNRVFHCGPNPQAEEAPPSLRIRINPSTHSIHATI